MMVIIIITWAFIIWGILNIGMVMVSTHNRDFPFTNFSIKDRNLMNLICHSSYLITLFIVF